MGFRISQPRSRLGVVLISPTMRRDMITTAAPILLQQVLLQLLPRRARGYCGRGLSAPSRTLPRVFFIVLFAAAMFLFLHLNVCGH